MFKEIKYFIQRGKRGYSDRDLWNFSDYLSEMMPKVLRHYKGNVGCPSNFYDKEAINNEYHKWDETLEAIAQGFEAAKYLNEHTFIKDLDKQKNLEEKMKLGLNLFVENYLSLWN